MGVLIAGRLPAVPELAAAPGLVALVFGIGPGVHLAIRRDGWHSNTIMTLPPIGVSLPAFSQWSEFSLSRPWVST